tara:strand:- start:1392 stop:1691 length:300 start_codon:yes stop_codon:yes gene_type:complete
MNLVLCLCPDGKTRSFSIDHKNLNVIFDNQTLQFCGSLENAVAVARLHPREHDETNVFTLKYPQYFDVTKGDILLLGSDEKGFACDIDLVSIMDILKLK